MTNQNTPGELRRRHDAAIAAIRAFIEQRGYPPTVRELGDILHRSSGSIQPLLLQLEEHGRIRRVAGRSRAIEIVDDPAHTVLGVDLPATTDLIRQIGLVQRLAEALERAGAELRHRELYVAAAEVEYAAQSLIAGADRQLDVMRDQKAARLRMESTR